jgi:hypothetical protein
VIGRHEYKTTKQKANIWTKSSKQIRKQLNYLRVINIKRNMFLEISVDLLTALATEAHLAEGQWQEEQLSIVKLRYVPSRNTNTDSFKNMGVRFKAITNI